MKIGIDARPLSRKRAGIANYIYNIIKELYKIDRENEYYLYSDRPFELPFAENDQWHRCIHPHKIGTLWYCFQLPHILRKDCMDVLWGTQHVLPFGNRNIRYVLTIHDMAIFYLPHVSTRYNYLVNKLLVPFSARKADKIIAVSRSTAKDVCVLLQINKSKVEVVYEAGNDSYFRKDRQISKQIMTSKYGVPEEYILYLGTLEPRKNVETLLKAYSKLVRKGNARHMLVIAGAKGWKYEGIFKLIDELDINEKVLFTGYIDNNDMIDLYNASSLFVFPSIYEGFGLPVVEAMQCGVPVITTNVSSLPEVAGDAAVLIDPYDVDGLCESMDNILSDDSYSELLREKSLLQAQKFSWGRAAEETYRVLTRK